MAQGRSNQSGHEDMDWQAETGERREDGMRSSIVGKNLQEAQRLLKLGLQEQLKSQFKIPLDLKVCETGLQVTIPSNISDHVLGFVSNFQRQIRYRTFPCHVVNCSVLLLPAIKRGLLDALEHIAVDLEFDVGKAEFFIYSREESTFQKTIQILKGSLIEFTIQIDSFIGLGLSQNDRWCTFLESVKSHHTTCDFTLKLDETSVVITGLRESVHRAHGHIKSIIDDLKVSDICKGSERNALGNVNQRMDKPREVKVDFLVDNHDVFAYINTFVITLNGVPLDAIEGTVEKGFLLKGQSADVEAAENLLGDFAEKVLTQTFTYQDNGYFSTKDGQQFLEEIVEQDCKVLWEKCNRTGAVNDKIHSAGSQASSWDETDRHQYWTWEIDDNSKIVLAEMKVNEISSEVVVNIKDMNKSSSAELEWQEQSSVILVQLPVPKYRPSADFDSMNEKFREIFYKLREDKLQSVAVSIDSTGSWALQAIVPRIIRSFTEFLREESHGKSTKLSLLLCSTVTENLKKAEKMIPSIVEEELEKQKKDLRGSGKFGVRVTEGSLHEAQADILVNTIHPELDLKKGTVSRALHHGAGKQMQSELYTNYKDGLSPTDIAVTRGYKLKCQNVLHGILLPFDGDHADARRFYENAVNDFVTKCMTKASELGCKSMAFPAIGSGRLEYPINIVASEMFWAVEEFQTKHPDSCVGEVVFVIYPTDTEAVQLFKMEEKNFLERLEKASKEKKTRTTLRLIGPRENIDKATQTISDRLEWLLEKSAENASPVLEEIHGVSEQSYQLLRFFHKEVLQKYEENGHKFEHVDEVLIIRSPSKDIEIVKAELNHCLAVNKKLCEDEVSYDGIEPEIVEQKLKDRNEDVCFIMDRKERKVLLFGEHVDTVKRQKLQLNAVLKILVVNKSMRNEQGNTLKDDNVADSSVMPNAGTMGQTGRSKPADNNVQVKVNDIQYGQFMMMKYMAVTFFQNCNISYDPNLEQVLIERKCMAEFNEILSKVRNLQSQDIRLPKPFSIKVGTIFESDNVVCVFNEATSAITVFAQDMQAVEDKMHQIKVDFGLVERSDRAARQLTESIEIPKSPEPKDQQKQNYSGGARPKHAAGQTPASTPALPNCRTYFTKENLHVRVYTQNILHLHVDCIVNAANESLKHGGGIAEVISKAAGSKLDRDCNEFIRRNGPLTTGGVYASDAGKLPYKCVIHAVGPRWSNYKPHHRDDVNRCQRDLFMAVLNSFLKAEEKGMKTIAVPAISSAVFRVPKPLCTEMYAAAILAYSKQSSCSKTRLAEIHFIDNKTDIIQLIHDEFRKQIPHGILPEFLQKKSSPPKHPVSAGAPGPSKPSDKPKQHDPKPLTYPFPYYEEKASDGGFRKDSFCHFSSALRLVICTGSIFDRHYATVDAAVCSEDKNGHGQGYTSKTLLGKGRPKYKLAREAAFRRQPNFGDVVYCRGEETGFKKVFHTVMWINNKTDTHEQRCNKFRKMFKTLLQTVVSERCQSIVMPLLFTGQGKTPTDFCTERFLEACLAFSKEDKHSRLTIYLVNSEQWKTDTIGKVTQSFVDVQTAKRRTSQSKPAPSRPPYPHQRKGSPVLGGQRKPASNLSRSQTDRRKHNGGRDVHRMSSSFTSMGVGSGGSQSSRSGGSTSTFYDDTGSDYDDGRDSQGPSVETNDDNSDNDNDGKDSQDENCVICMDTVNKPKKLKCGHVFCTDCIDSYFSNYKKVCPTCGVVCGVVKGDQPPGKMDVRFDQNFHCAGYERVGTHIVTYSFNSGTQGPDHPNPGRPYKGITRTAFLPDTKEGREVLQMLKVAFERKLVFTIGSSRTTGQEGVITWNDIHHKTNHKPNTPFGYPDPGYLDRVKDELAAKGVTPDDIGSK